MQRAKATGYLSQDPRSDAVPDDTNCLAHVLSGRGLDDSSPAPRSPGSRWRRTRRTANIERFFAAQEKFESEGGYAAESEVRKLAAGVGLADDRLDLHLGALSGGERRRLELVRILFTGSELLLLDEPTNHLDANARDWLLKLLRTYRGALLVVSHDLDLLDDAITRVVHVDRESEGATGNLVEYKGTYSQYLTARERDEERMLEAGEAPGVGDRAPVDARPTRCAGRPPSAHVSPRTSTTASPRSKPRRSQNTSKRRKMNREVPEAAALRPHRAHRDRALEDVRRARRVLRRAASTSAAASACS